jgi:pyridinium-3,5-bisthiocarboxylic acid mononucleotide nickel chelatase
MKVLYFDCFSGISGDMTLGALLDLGLDKEVFLSELQKLNLEGYRIEFTKIKKNGIEGTDVNVILEEHTCLLSECHHQGKHSHEHRNLQDIETIINESTLDDYIKNLSKDMFLKVAKAEAKVHGTSIEKVHFHEVGATDSIIDIVGTAICIHMLQVDKIISSPMHDGTGFIRCQHGIIPVPVPATMEILTSGSIPFYTSEIQNELVTPTGAAIIATLADVFGNMPQMFIDKVGYGTGKRQMEIPGLLRAIIGRIV